jgi:hypothetical protein
LDFATELSGKERKYIALIKKPAVLGAVIDLGLCLDLLDSEYISIVKNGYTSLENSYKITGINLPKNKPLKGSIDLLLRRPDCIVIENVHRGREINNLRPFDSVRGIFTEGQSIYPMRGLTKKTIFKFASGTLIALKVFSCRLLKMTDS